METVMEQAGGRYDHVKQRAAERYGLELSLKEIDALSTRIAFREASGDGGCIPLGKSYDKYRWAIWYKGEWVFLITGRNTRVVTILPKHELKPYKHLLPW